MTLENLVDFINQEKGVDLRLKGSAGRKKFYIRVYFLMAYKYFIDISHADIGKEINRDHATSIHHKNKMIDLMSIYKSDRDEYRQIEHGFLEKYPELNETKRIYEDYCNYSTLDITRKLVKIELALESLKRDYSKALTVIKSEKKKVLNRDNKIAVLKSKKGFISQLTRSLDAAKRTIEKTVRTNDNLRQSNYYWKKKCQNMENIEVKLEKVS